MTKQPSFLNTLFPALACLCFVLVFNQATFAQTSKPASKELTFNEALELALKNDPDLQAARYQHQSIVQTTRLSRSSLLPQIEARLFSNRNDQEISGSSNTTQLPNSKSDIDNTGYSISLTQTLYNHGYYKQLQQSELNLASATAELEAARQDLIIRLAESYFNILSAQDNLAFARAERDAIARQLEQSQSRFEVGLITITEVKEAQASYDTSVALEIDAQNQLDASIESLTTILGSHTDKLVNMKADIALRMPSLNDKLADIRSWTNQSIENNLNLKAAQFSFQAMKKQVDKDRAGHYPQLDLTANHISTDIENTSSANYENNSNSIGLQLTIPVYSGGNTSAQLKQSVALQERYRVLAQKAKRLAVQQTREAYLGISSSISQTRALKQALLSTQAAHEATLAELSVGKRTVIDVFDALREVYKAERDYARARYNFVINLLRLKQAAGILSIDDGKLVDSFLK